LTIIPSFIILIFCPFALVSDEINEMAIFFYMIYTIYRDIIIIKIDMIGYNIVAYCNIYI
jgi:hypothetical protein